MPTNPYFNNSSGEQNLVEGITIEIIFGEDPGSSFVKYYPLEMYLQ